MQVAGFAARAPATVLAALLSVVSLVGQKGLPAVDPYTRNRPEALAKAGYVGFGPFEFAAEHTTRDIEEILGHVALIWVETEHFRIGCSLTAYTVAGDSIQRRKISAELAQLRKTLPRVPRKTRRLDRWLRLHLFAYRLESTYDDFQRRLDVTDADFPIDADESTRFARFMGLGPYLGMASKFTVLLFARRSSFGRYFASFIGDPPDYPHRYHFGESGSLLFATAAEFNHGQLFDDTNMHCHVVFNVVHNLLNGYRGYRQDVPGWFKSGLGQWYLRRIDPHWNNLNQMAAEEADARNTWDWAPQVRALVKFGSYVPADKLLGYWDYTGWKFEDHMQCWSRVDFLMSLGNKGFATYVDVMKDPFDGPDVPSREQVLARQDLALRDAWDMDATAFDERWTKWVLAANR